jgi:uncharacterized protein
VKIEVNRIPDEGMMLKESILPSELDLDTEVIRFGSEVSVTAKVSRITNAVTVRLDLEAKVGCTCSRCLKDFSTDLKKHMDLNFAVEKSMSVIDLNPEIREELILDFPINPLCRHACEGLCPKCGKDLNEGKCDCK